MSDVRFGHRSPVEVLVQEMDFRERDEPSRGLHHRTQTDNALDLTRAIRESVGESRQSKFKKKCP